MEKLKHVKECLMAQVQAQMANLNNVDAKELGEVIDMVKDLEEAIYYCTITEAMKKEKEEDNKHYYMPYYNPYEQSRMYDPYEQPRMYYAESNNGRGGENNSNNNSSSSSNNSGNGRRNYFGGGYEYPIELRDAREGKSPKTRRMYMESKEMHHDKTVQMQELEQYMKELTTDVVEMIQGSSPEEKQLLKSKLTTLVSKIDHA